MIPLKAKFSKEVNTVLDENLSENARARLRELIRVYEPLFGPINTNEAVKTAVRAEIRTSTSEPIYTKSYPYPACMREEVEKEIKELLAGGIIRPLI